MLGKPPPDFTLACTGGTTVALSATRRSKLGLCLYPKDNTPGCTAEGADFRDLHDQFHRAGKQKMRQFGVMKKKQMYGRNVRGIERSTFVVDPQGVLVREWRGVKVPGHAQEVSNFVKAL